MKTFKKITLAALSLTAALTAATLTSACQSAEVRRNSASVGKIYTFESDANGFNTRNYFYDNGEEVVAFDTQFTPELAQKSIDFLRTKTSNPIAYVVITHPNPDKFNGMNVFQKLGAKVIASNKTQANMPGVHAYKRYYFVNVAKMFTDATYPKLSQADIGFDQSYSIHLKDGESIALQELSQPGVSTNQTVAYIPQANAAIVGDLIHHQVHAWLEGGIVNGKPVPTLTGWISDLRQIETELQDEPQTMLYGGRGEAVALHEGIDEQIGYLNKADQLVTQYVAGLGSAQEDDQAVQKIFEAKFPGYGLGYMIGYGVYGLVGSKR
jgi:glyoxylase-like metal-dependent hydrolase (beta-lactamase superfamily II)